MATRRASRPPSRFPMKVRAARTRSMDSTAAVVDPSRARAVSTAEPSSVRRVQTRCFWTRSCQRVIAVDLRLAELRLRREGFIVSREKQARKAGDANSCASLYVGIADVPVRAQAAEVAVEV